MTPKDYQEMLHSVHGRIRIEIIQCEELLRPHPIAVIMQHKTYHRLMVELEPSYVTIPSNKIYDIEILISDKIPIDMAFVYKENHYASR